MEHSDDWPGVLAAEIAQAEQALLASSGGAALCRLPGVTLRDEVKAQEGRLAALLELRRGLREAAADVVLARVEQHWQAALERENRRSEPSADWLAYRRGGVAALVELRQRGVASSL